MSMQSPDIGNGASEQERLINVASQLNSEFREGHSVYTRENLKLIRSIPNPIVVGFEGIFVSDEEPWNANPYASEFLGKLKEAGTVIVVPSGQDGWQTYQAALERQFLWDDDVILMTPTNYVQTEENIEVMKAETSNYIGQIHMEKGRQYSQTDFTQPEDYKRLGPVFKKVNTPIIDSTSSATENNPGMIGITVTTFTPETRESSIQTQGDFSLSEAADQVTMLYKIPAPLLPDLVISNIQNFLHRRIDYWDMGAFRVLPFREFENDPEKLIKAKEETLTTRDMEDDMEGKRQFGILRTKYGIHIPNFNYIFGPSDDKKRYFTYIVSNKVHGQNSRSATFDTTEERGEFIEKADTKFSNVAQYLIDVYNNPGPYLQDLAPTDKEDAVFDQYIYGGQKGEEEKQLYLVDLDPHILQYDGTAASASGLFERLTMLWTLANKIESSQGANLEKTKDKILTFFRSIPLNGEHAYTALMARRRINDPEVRAEEQESTEIEEKLSPYNSLIPELDIDEESYALTAESFFQGYTVNEILRDILLAPALSPDLLEALQDSHDTGILSPEDKERYRQIIDSGLGRNLNRYGGKSGDYRYAARRYLDFSESGFRSRITGKIMDSFRERIGAETLKELEDRYGGLSLILVDKIKARVAEIMTKNRKIFQTYQSRSYKTLSEELNIQRNT